MDTQPPPDEQISEAQQLLQAYRRVIARKDYQHLLTLHLMELIDIYSLIEVQKRLASIEQTMALGVSTKDDPRR